MESTLTGDIYKKLNLLHLLWYLLLIIMMTRIEGETVCLLTTR
jgi:hypothetical protein